MKKAILVCVLLLDLLFASAQNLIPDSSFEMNTFVPMDFSSLGASQSWHIPSRGTSDLFCKCDKKTKEKSGKKIYSEVDVPQNTMGYQDAHSGTCYAGLFVFSHGNYREYIQTMLKEPLIRNKVYLFTMYISLADYSSLSVDKVGVCFLPGKANYQSSDVITGLNPVYMNTEREPGNDVKSWHRLAVTYKAKGGEQYLLIGSFVINKIRRTRLKAPKEIRTRINQKVERDAYYFIDDVCLVETDSREPEDSLKANADLFNDIRPDTLLILKHVLFQTGETALNPSSCAELDQLVAYLKMHINKQIEISGHTDNSGNDRSNQKLSVARATSVAAYFTSHGINTERVSYKGYGSSKPITTNNTNEGRQLNRRVEFIVR